MISILTAEQRAKPKAILASEAYHLEPDGFEQDGEVVYLTRRSHRLVKISAEAWGLVWTEMAEGIDSARARVNPETTTPEPIVDDCEDADVDGEQVTIRRKDKTVTMPRAEWDKLRAEARARVMNSMAERPSVVPASPGRCPRCDGKVYGPKQLPDVPGVMCRDAFHVATEVIQ